MNSSSKQSLIQNKPSAGYFQTASPTGHNNLKQSETIWQKFQVELLLFIILSRNSFVRGWFSSETEIWLLKTQGNVDLGHPPSIITIPRQIEEKRRGGKRRKRCRIDCRQNIKKLWDTSAISVRFQCSFSAVTSSSFFSSKFFSPARWKVCRFDQRDRIKLNFRVRIECGLSADRVRFVVVLLIRNTTDKNLPETWRKKQLKEKKKRRGINRDCHWKWKRVSSGGSSAVWRSRNVFTKVPPGNEWVGVSDPHGTGQREGARNGRGHGGCGWGASEGSRRRRPRFPPDAQHQRPPHQTPLILLGAILGESSTPRVIITSLSKNLVTKQQ